MGTFIGVLIVIGFVLFIAKAGGGLKKKKKLNKYIEKLENRLEESRKKTSNIKGPNIEDYPGSPQYQALLKKYNGNIPGAGQGDQSKGKTKGRNLGSQYGKKGGRYNERVSKNGNRYRQYF